MLIGSRRLASSAAAAAVRVRFQRPAQRAAAMHGSAQDPENFVRIKRQLTSGGPVSKSSSSKRWRHLDDPPTVDIIGAPMTYGQPLDGTDVGPELIRSLGLASRLSTLGWRVADTGDIDFRPPRGGDPSLSAQFGKARNAAAVMEGAEQLAQTVESSIQRGRFPLIVGGDHSISLGSVAGVLRARPDTAIIWVDAHADINTPATSPSGNMHGMPLGFLCKLPGTDPAHIPGAEWLLDVPKIDPAKLAYIGLRDVDAGEAALLRPGGPAAAAHSYSMFHVDKYGIGNVVQRVLDSTSPDTPIHVSFDIDAVDPVEAPSTGTVVRGGLSYREAHFICEAISETGRLASMDIVEVNPMLSRGAGAEATADLALALVESAMGNQIL